MSPNSSRTEPKPTWPRVWKTAPQVVPAILGSHHTTSTIARIMPATPCATCLRPGRHTAPGDELSLVTTFLPGPSRQTVEDVAGDGRAWRVGRVHVPLAAEDHVIQWSRDSQECCQGAIRPTVRACL